MGRLDVEALRYMDGDDFRVLQAVEAGMRNHELVSTQLACSLANLRSGGAQKTIRRLQNNKLLAYERGRRYDGHRLTVSGYDFLALHSLVADDVLDGFGNQIGTGKESDVYAAYDTHGEPLALKMHRLGRTSFRRLKLLRDYHRGRSHISWLYLSTLSARKEFSYMKALHERGFPVPRPVRQNRHVVLMSIVEGVPLCEMHDVASPQQLYAECMELMVRLAECGVIHCDFNEFNLMVDENEHVVLIDFPQMVSTSHVNAEHLFQRDVDCLRRFFQRRFHFESDDFPVFAEVVRTEDMDTEVRASGYSRQFDEFDRVAGVGGDSGDESGSDDESGDGEHGKTTRRSEGDAQECDSAEEQDTFEDAVESFVDQHELELDEQGRSDQPDEQGRSDQPDTPRSFPLDCSDRVALRGSGDVGDREDSVPDSSGSGDDTDELEDSVRRRRQLRQLKQQRLEQQRLEARSVVSAAVARSVSHRSGSTAASTIAPEVLQSRLARELRRQRRRQAERLRAKGDASAVTRTRRDNADNIRDSTGGFWAD